MIKTIKTLAALLIIGATFTSCTQDKEETPTPQMELSDFAVTYQYITGSNREFTIEFSQEFDAWTGEALSEVEARMVSTVNPEDSPETLTNIQRVDSKSFSFDYNWAGVDIVGDSIVGYYGEGLIFMDDRGIKKLSIDHTNGVLYKAVEVK